MNYLLLIFGSLFILMTINANLIQLVLDRKTKFKKFDIYDQTGILFLFVFFGVFCLPFMKQIKRHRRILYFRKRLKGLKEYPTFVMISNPSKPITPNDIDKEILNIERLLKLERLKRKV